MKGHIGAAFRAECRLFRMPYSVLLYVAIVVVALCSIPFCTAQFGGNEQVSAFDAEKIRFELAETESAIAILGSVTEEEWASYDEETRRYKTEMMEELLAERALYSHFLKTGTYPDDYVEVPLYVEYMSDVFQMPTTEATSSLVSMIAMFPIWALLFAVICLARGIWRTCALSAPSVKTRLLGNCSRRDCFLGGVALDACILGVILIAVSAVRSIYASTGSADMFYVIDGSEVRFGNIAEVMSAQFLASTALGAAAYFWGAFSAVLSQDRRIAVAILSSAAAIGVSVAVGCIFDLAIASAPSCLLIAPFVGTAFCVSGFRGYPYYLHLAVCVAAAAIFGVFALRGYCRKVEVLN